MNTCVCISLLLLIQFAAPTFVCARTEETGEAATLTAWKNTAYQTAVGSELVKILDTTNSILKTNPKHRHALYLRGYLYGIIGCTGSAIADLSRAIEIDPSYAPAYTERGICYMDLKNYQQARQDLERAIALDPSSGDARFAHGKLMLELDKPSAAEGDFRACQSSQLKFTPALPGELPANYYNGPNYYLGVCEEALGRTDSALRLYKSSIKSGRLGGSGYIKRFSDQPLDASTRVSRLELGL